jgi:hypothetical protein
MTPQKLFCSIFQSFNSTRGQIDSDDKSEELQKISKSLKTVCEAYKEQSLLMMTVADNIGVCGNFDQVLQNFLLHMTLTKRKIS